MDIKETLEERGSNYGDFKKGAEIMQEIKDIIRANGSGLSLYQREALEMIAHKIGRILNGDPNYIDSWIDVAGYSQLVVDELEKSGKRPFESCKDVLNNPEYT